MTPAGRTVLAGLALILAAGVSVAQVPSIAMMEIPAGSFDMGSARPLPGFSYRNEMPVHRVTLSAFRLATTEVTQAQFEAVMGYNPSRFVGAELPVAQVGWYEAIEFANALSRRAGLRPAYRVEPGAMPTAPLVYWDRDADGYRLPTEAEWEYAARGGASGDGERGSGSAPPPRAEACAAVPALDPVAWYCGNTPQDGGMPVGRKAANGYGLYDMLGNVWEWVWDWDNNFVPAPYAPEPQTDPTGKPGNGPGARLLRGGSWYWPASSARVTTRIAHVVWLGYSHVDFGFRLARNAAPSREEKGK